MNTQTAPATPRLHPLLATAAIAVTTFSLAGIAAMSGWLPMTQAAAPQTSATAVSPAPTFAETKQVSEPRPVEKPVRRAAPKPEARTATTAPAVETVLPAPPLLAQAAPACANCGTIDNVREVTQAGEGSGLGAVVGGVLGGLLGSQVGGGNGKNLAAVLGAAGGAYAGHQVEKTRKQTTRYEITVRMEDGTQRTLTQDSVPPWRIGERVRFENGQWVATN